jgi:hypothetical protein
VVDPTSLRLGSVQAKLAQKYEHTSSLSQGQNYKPRMFKKPGADDTFGFGWRQTRLMKTIGVRGEREREGRMGREGKIDMRERKREGEREKDKRKSITSDK